MSQEQVRQDVAFAVLVALHPHFGQQRPAVTLYSRPVWLAPHFGTRRTGSSQERTGASWLADALAEAQERAANHPDPEVRARSQETVDLCHERMRADAAKPCYVPHCTSQFHAGPCTLVMP